jgi:ABC-type nitrate/sulfonate/bicarbonate transport system permease component
MVSSDHIDAVRIEGPSEFGIFRTVILPSVTPVVLSGLKGEMAALGGDMNPVMCWHSVRSQ